MNGDIYRQNCDAVRTRKSTKSIPLRQRSKSFDRFLDAALATIVCPQYTEMRTGIILRHIRCCDVSRRWPFLLCFFAFASRLPRVRTMTTVCATALAPRCSLRFPSSPDNGGRCFPVATGAYCSHGPRRERRTTLIGFVLGANSCKLGLYDR